MHFNDPNWGRAASNLAAAFAPPSGQEIAGFARAGLLQTQRNAMDAEAQRLADLYRMATAPDFNQDQFDRMGMAVGNWNPNQSYYAVDTQDATNRRGQDVQSQTSLAMNAANNARALQQTRLQNQASLAGTFFGPLNEGQVQRAVPEGVAGLFQLPAVEERQGLPKPLTESQVKGRNLQGLIDSGDITTQMIIEDFLGNQTPVEGYDDQGNVRFMSPGAAVRTGATPYDAPSNVPRNYVMRDGRNFITFDGATDAQTGQPLPPGGAISNVEGGAEDVGLPTTATRSQLQQGQIEVNKFNVLLDRARELSTDPANFGIPGAVKGAAQDATAIAEGIATGLGFTSPREALESIRNDAAANGIDPSLLPGVFDPSLPALHTVADLLVYQAAAALAGQSGRAVSDYDVRRFKNVVGDPRSFMMNRERFLAKLDELQRLVSGVSQVNTQALTGGVAGVPQQPPQPPQPPSPPSPPAPTTASPGADGGTAVIQTPQGQVTIRRID